jgi:competence protein ComEA
MIAAGGAGEHAPAAPPLAPRLVVDLNSAPPEVLQALPHLGPATVARIVEARRAAPFRSLDDLGRRVRGIGPATVGSLRPFLSVEPADAEPPRPAVAIRIP